MPKKNIIGFSLPVQRYDRCYDCPLLGIILDRKEARIPPKSQKNYVCIARRAAMSLRRAKSRESDSDYKHKRHKPCDGLWEHWNGYYGMPVFAYMKYRMPFEQRAQLEIDFDWDRK
ncbi:MAG: hypothetical protein LUD72_06190 [Bacteroidales bacterium]|nr:hypothetical protein [Bacteroidales bacterium]